jgi:hypothetical protein
MSLPTVIITSEKATQKAMTHLSLSVPNAPRIAVPEQKDVAKVLELDEIDDLGDVGFSVYFGACEVRPFVQRAVRAMG